MIKLESQTSHLQSSVIRADHDLNHLVPIYLLPFPCKSKDYFLNGFSVKTIVLVGIYNQQFQGTIILMVFDFQGFFL